MNLILFIGLIWSGAVAQDAFPSNFIFKCSTALLCVDKSQCDINGWISPNPTPLSAAEESRRAPLLPCPKPEGGMGYCCRDPDYRDDWPNNIGNAESSVPRPSGGGGFGCPARNRTAMPDKNPLPPFSDNDFDAGAGEFPWQGAVLSKDNKLLCGCYFTENNTCTTTASCVAKSKPEDLKIAVGIYDIAQPIKVQEVPSGDKKAQISPAKYIAFDPEYNPTTGKRDIAVIHIAKEAEYNYYTLPICLDRPKAIPFFKYDDCVVTGWGKKDNTYHWADVRHLTEEECEELVPGFDRVKESCARPERDVCELMEFGSGFQCRKTGQRDKPGDDVYWLKGVYSSVNTCDPVKQVITYSRIEFEDWFDEALQNPLKFGLKNRK